jgi:CheY-like chemotaxis protein
MKMSLAEISGVNLSPARPWESRSVDGADGPDPDAAKDDSCGNFFNLLFPPPENSPSLPGRRGFGGMSGRQEATPVGAEALISIAVSVKRSKEAAGKSVPKLFPPDRVYEEKRIVARIACGEHGIVARHKGWIEVSSQIGVGSTFRAHLPASTEVIAMPGKTADKKVHGGTERVLLAEDDQAVRNVVRDILKKYGYVVMEADSGISAQQVWATHDGQFDLLLTDMVMPGGVTGLELADLLRAQKKGLKVVLMSGYGGEQAGAEMAKAKGLTFLHKPFSCRVLSETVRQCLDTG